MRWAWADAIRAAPRISMHATALSKAMRISFLDR